MDGVRPSKDWLNIEGEIVLRQIDHQRDGGIALSSCFGTRVELICTFDCWFPEIHCLGELFRNDLVDCVEYARHDDDLARTIWCC